jgi:D-amino-acid oxidase
MTSPPSHIIILGAGVTALQTALSLLTAHPNYTITLIAAHVPGDSSIDYTSPLAGGHWRSHDGLAPSDALPREWDARTYQHWTQLLKDGDGKAADETYADRVARMGLGFKESRNYWGTENEETKPHGEGLWWKNTVDGFTILDLPTLTDEPPPAGAIFGLKYQSICINVPQYLRYLHGRVISLGARIIQSPVAVSGGLAGAVRDAKRILLSSDPSITEGSILALVNATGLSARHIVHPDEAAKLYPIRGQTVLVKGEAARARTLVGFPGADDIAYVIPRPGSGTTILGGSKQVGSWDEEVDGVLNERILERVVSEGMAEELRTGPGRGFEVLSYQVGWRPGRKGGPRVEGEGEKVDGVWVVHAYGHAGGGYQNSVGSAERVVAIIEGL